MPLVVALHGNGDTAENFMAALQFTTRANTHGFVLAAPQGITQDLFGNQLDWDAYNDEPGNIDLPAIDDVIAQLVESGEIDTRRIMVFGYSQGGYLAFFYAMRRSATLACAVVAAAAASRSGVVGTAARAIPFAMQVGSQDWAISNARSTRDALIQAGHPVDYHEIVGAGHVPFPGDPGVPLGECLGRLL